MRLDALITFHFSSSTTTFVLETSTPINRLLNSYTQHKFILLGTHTEERTQTHHNQLIASPSAYALFRYLHIPKVSAMPSESSSSGSGHRSHDKRKEGDDSQWKVVILCSRCDPHRRNDGSEAIGPKSKMADSGAHSNSGRHNERNESDNKQSKEVVLCIECNSSSLVIGKATDTSIEKAADTSNGSDAKQHGLHEFLENLEDQVVERIDDSERVRRDKADAKRKDGEKA